jgi:membrane protein
MSKKLSRLQRLRENAQAFLDESALCSQKPLSKLEKFAHFWLLVWRSFNKNRLPVRASGLAYVTLLALIPMLAVVMSITSSFLKKEGEDRIDQFIVKMVATLTPPGDITTNAAATTAESTNAVGALAGGTNAVARTNSLSITNLASTGTPLRQESTAGTNVTTGQETNSTAKVSPALDERARHQAAREINQFIQKTRSGTLGVTGSVLLIFAAIGLLSRIEDTFNDIWGVSRGRSWFMRIVLYWGVLSLAPLLLVVAIGLASGPHLAGTRHLVETMPFVGSLMFRVLPVVVLCLTTSLLYMLMPNIKVRWQAALVGGIVGGLLFHANNMISVLYVSRVVSSSKIYGSIGLVPVFMIGLYFCWLILLFGAQVTYAFQNRETYLEEKQVETVNQRGREFIALRLMTCVGQRFGRGDPAPGLLEISQELLVPTRLVWQIMQPLATARLVVETNGVENGYMPARPLEQITCHDVLLAMRSSQGQELATREGPTRAEVYGEFSRIEQAERDAASAVTLLALVNRAQAQLGNSRTVSQHSLNPPTS